MRFWEGRNFSGDGVGVLRKIFCWVFFGNYGDGGGWEFGRIYIL